jgi:hypothetical protein
MTRFEREKGTPTGLAERRESTPTPAFESREPYVVGEGEPLLLPGDDAALREVIRALFSTDVANITPVEALVRLNEWQKQLRGED